MTSRIQQIIDQTGPAVFPGVYDTLSARIAEQVGFPMALVSGYSVAATTIGEPDFGLLTQTEMVDRVRRICLSVNIPILADADTGYGNPLNVYRTVKELIAAGAAGCFLEDQVWPKKCGHMRGKKIVERSEYVARIQAAVEARGQHDFFIIARSDALALAGLDEAIERVQGARQLGANASFVEAPQSKAHLEEIGQRVPAPRVANMIEGGKTPVLTRDELGDLGFEMILYPLSGLFSAARMIRLMFERLRYQGTTRGHEHELLSFDEFNQLIGLEEKYRLGQQFGVEAAE